VDNFHIAIGALSDQRASASIDQESGGDNDPVTPEVERYSG
jgi:hypothetical protein